MKIGIDVNALTRPYQHGTKRYVEELINGLASIDKINTYILFASKNIVIPDQKNFRTVKIPNFPILKRQFFLPIAVRKEMVDVFHNTEPYGSILWKYPNTVTTVHDLDLGTVYPTFRSIKYFLQRYYSELTRYFLFRNSKVLISVSKNTLGDLKKYLSKWKMRKNIRVIHEAVSPIFTDTGSKAIQNKYFLCMGDFSPRKNLKTIFSAYSQFPPDFKNKQKLKVIVSTKKEAAHFLRQAKIYSISDWIKIIIAPNDNELKKMYQSATCFLYPSLYEGFGLPILEAMNCGCPVITSNYGATKEVAGNAAILINPTSTREIFSAMLKITTDQPLRNKLITRGKKRAKEFSWKRMATQTLSVYNTLMSKPRKTSTFFKRYNNKILALLGFCLLLFGIFLFIHERSSNTWSSFVADGEIQGQLFKKDNTLIFGTNDKKLYFTNTSIQGKTQILDLNGNVTPQAISGNNILAISDDKVWLINIGNQKVIWQVSTDNQYFFQKATIYKNYVLAASEDGSLSALRLSDGKLLWKFTPKPLYTLSSVINGWGIYYFGDLTVANNTVYVASRDKTLYALRLNTGKILWKTDIGDLMTNGPELYGKYLFIATNSNKSIALDKYTGKILWEVTSGSPISSTTVMSSFSTSDNPILQYLANINNYIHNWFSIGPIAYFEVHEDGTVVRRDGKTGAIIWQSDELGQGLNYPSFWKSKAMLTSQDGKAITLSLASGKKSAEVPSLGFVNSPALIKPVLAGLIPGWLNPFTPDYFVSNQSGDLFYINGGTGKTSWEFSANAPTSSNIDPYLSGKYIFFATSDGVIYKINDNTGLPDLTSGDQQFEVSQSFTKIASVNVFELTLKSSGTFVNPWREADLTAVFTHESGRVVEIPGFYYDQNIWKVRFNPPLKGKWTWKIIWVPHGKTLTKTGELTSTTDTSNFYLRTNLTNPKRLTTDGKTIFNGLGIGDTMIDFNYDGTPLDDWAIGNSTPLANPNGFGYTNSFRSDKINSLNDYISAYGPAGAGFNMFRWSLLNSSMGLWNEFGFPTEYSILQGKIGDTLVESLRNNDIHVWLTLFGFDIPFKGSQDPATQYLLTSYIRYVFARYGAYVDIWELANEVIVPDSTSTLLTDEIRSLDYENRPISISSEPYNYGDSDIIAPHWYETENISQSDLTTVQHIQQFENYPKPVVFAEQGNYQSNDDQTSADRMRIRAWTAFFQQGILMFWNQSDSTNIKVGENLNANIYLGDVERSYTRILQNFSQSFPLDSKSVQYALDKFGVRGYGLISDSINAGYFYHYSSPFTPTTFTLTISTKSEGEIQWFNPSTGNIIKTEECPAIRCNVTSPSFTTDVSFKLD